jgi:transcriptional regulator with XRE-family HTH domain
VRIELDKSTIVVIPRPWDLATLVGMSKGRPALPPKGIGIVWKALRDQRGWSVARTVEETGISKALIHFIENGTKPNPGRKVLEKASGAFKVPVKALLFDPDAEQPEHLRRFLAYLKRRGVRVDVVHVAKLSVLADSLGREPDPHEYEVWWGLVSARIGPTSDPGSSLPDAPTSSSAGAGASPGSTGGGRGR